jgi:Putative Ig domain
VIPAALRRILFCFACCFLVGRFLVTAASAQITSSPSSLTFAKTYVGMASPSKTITVTNTGTASATITAITSSCREFPLASGQTPATLAAKGTTTFSMIFVPDSAKTFNCTYTLTLQTGSPLVVPLTATGLASKAVVSVSPTSLSFPNQPEGTASATQLITISNTGTGPVILQGITITPPTFSVSGAKLPVTINANASTTVSIGYSPALVTSETGVVGLTFNQIPVKVVDLSGNGSVASSLALLNIPTLSEGTQGAAYQAQLSAASGTPPYTFSLKPGSTLPTGLTLSGAGLISGTIASTVTAGNYTFTAGVKDNQKHNVTKLFTLTVAKATGSACNNISYNVPNTATPIVPIPDLATGSYQGEEGGLYPNGSNVRPPAHDSDGVAIAKAIVPLDSNGNYSPTGKDVLLALGESTALDEFEEFLPLARNDPARNSVLVFVDGAQGGATPSLLTSTNSPYWNTIMNNYLPDQGVTANQVVAVWVEDSNGIAKGTFPGDMTQLQGAYETVMNNVHTFFPHAVLTYFSSRIYAGYSNGIKTINPEPYAYEAGFAVKNAIADQLNGNSNLNYNSALGPVKAPWMSWGPYYWANGMLGRSDGFVWTCQDLQSDGTHPSSPSGDLKVAGEVLNFFKTDGTTTPWFLHP